MFEIHEPILRSRPLAKSRPEAEARQRAEKAWILANKTSDSKRIFDVAASLFMLPLAAVIILPLALLILITDRKGGVFFIQPRTGRQGTVFHCLKLRTMRQTSESEDSDLQGRITRLGRVLRRTHLDELPQLVNVLRGEMSLVGPRPHMLSDTERFSDMDERYHQRHAVRPGITGWAQVNGYYGHVDGISHLRKRIDFDLEYAANPGVFRDIRILIQTLKMQLVSL